MSRDFKFRIWDQRVPGSLMSYDDGHFSISAHGEVFCVNDDVSIENDSFLMQYTGRKDNTGVELYEGDIVPVQGMIHLGWKQGTYRFKGNGKVVYLADAMRFAFIVNTEEYGYQIVCYDKGIRQQYEVIGNIYENPELLNT
ncbi:YopX family protein [Planococcus sp. SSTMD024]|uniref:YopX family protein n=1 Tax=Planococcus sp. SSTMD024 TaxID=3242163 RepID=UPI00351E16EC